MSDAKRKDLNSRLNGFSPTCKERIYCEIKALLNLMWLSGITSGTLKGPKASPHEETTATSYISSVV